MTGVLTGEDGTPRMFTQSFFLVPRESGYYVRNDMFRYVEATVSLLTSVGIAEAPEAHKTPEPVKGLC